MDVLISLGLSGDATTQEYATEAIAECLAVPAIQDQFVTIGGVLSILVHDHNFVKFDEVSTAVGCVGVTGTGCQHGLSLLSLLYILYQMKF